MRKYSVRAVVTSLIVLGFTVTASGQMRSGKIGIGVSGTGYVFQSDLKTNDLSGGGAVSLTYSAAEYVGLRSMLGAGYLAGKRTDGVSIQTNLYHGNLALSLDLMPHGAVNPYLYAGAGVVFFDPRTSAGAALTGAGVPRYDVQYFGGIGFDIFIDEFLALCVSGEGVFGFTDQLDGVKSGGNDYYGRVAVGLRYHFFDQGFVKRMLDAFEGRGK